MQEEVVVSDRVRGARDAMVKTLVQAMLKSGVDAVKFSQTLREIAPVFKVPDGTLKGVQALIEEQAAVQMLMTGEPETAPVQAQSVPTSNVVGTDLDWLDELDVTSPQDGLNAMLGRVLDAREEYIRTTPKPFIYHVQALDHEGKKYVAVVTQRLVWIKDGSTTMVNISGDLDPIHGLGSAVAKMNRDIRVEGVQTVFSGSVWVWLLEHKPSNHEFRLWTNLKDQNGQRDVGEKIWFTMTKDAPYVAFRRLKVKPRK